MQGEHLREFVEHADAGDSRPCYPVIQEQGGSLFIPLIPELPEILFQVIGHGEGLVETQRFFEFFFVP